MASTIPFFPGGLRPDSGGLAQSTDGFGKGDGGGGGPGPLPWHFQTRKLELLTAGLGQPVPLAYGRHLVGGNVIFIKKNLDKSRTVFVALGEGEWNAVEAVTVNGRGFNIYDSKRFHFHPGLDGELGVESDPAVRNQKICSLFPPRFVPQITFSRLAYISMRIPRPVWRKVGPFIEVAGVYETTRVRIFDNVGNQTAYQYSTNPAWIALDILIRRFIKPVGKINEALTTAEKNRINFQAFKDWADFCDFDIGGGTKRFEASIAYVDIADLLRALNHTLLLGRAFLLENNGAFMPLIDQNRASQMTVGVDDVLEGSLRLAQKELRGATNKFVGDYRSLVSGNGEGTISSTGKSLTGTDTKFNDFFQRRQWCQVRAGAQDGEARRVDTIEGDAALMLKSAFSVDQAGVAYGDPFKDFQEQVKEVVEPDHQDQVGREIVRRMDFGNNTGERVERLLEYLKRRIHDLPHKQVARLWPGTGALDLLPADVVTSFDSVDFDPSKTRTFEIVESSLEPDGSLTLFLEEFNASVFVDAASADQQEQAVVLAGDDPPAIVAENLTLSSAATDDPRNLFGNPSMVDPGSLPARNPATLHQWQRDKSGTGADPEYRNNGEIRLPAASAGGWVELLQFKDRDSILRGGQGCVQFWVRKQQAADPDPDGDVVILIHYYNSDGTFVSSSELERFSKDDLPFMGLSESYIVLTAQGFIITAPAGADRFAVSLRNEATNLDLYVTQAMLTRGLRSVRFIEQTDLTNVRQYAYEGDTPIVDDVTDANGTLVTDHIPSGIPGRGLKYTRLQPVGSGAKDMDVQANQFKRKAETASANQMVAYINDLILISPAYKWGADMTMIGSSGTDIRDVLFAHWSGNNNHFFVELRGNGDVVLRKRVAGAPSDLGTYSIVGFLNATTYRIDIQLAGGTVKVFVDNVERISVVDTDLAAAGQVGLGFRIDATTGSIERPTIDNLKLTYLQNTASPPAPPAPPGPPEPPPDSPPGTE